MRRYDLGDPVSLRKKVFDADGVPIAATTTLVVTRPDGTTTPPTVTNPETGVYDSTLPVASANQYGPYTYVWTVTGAVDDVSGGQFYVGPAELELPPLASLERLSRKLGYMPTDAEADRASDALNAASELIRDVAGKTWADDVTGALESVPRRVVTICVAAAYRSFDNPEALTQRSIGDSSKSFDRTGLDGGSDVYLTPGEEKSIRKAASSSSLASVTLVTPYNPSEILSPWDEVTAE